MPKQTKEERKAARKALIAKLKANPLLGQERLKKLQARVPKPSRSQRRRALHGRGAYDMGDHPLGLIGRGIGGSLGLLAGDPEWGWNAGARLSRKMGSGAYGIPWEATDGGFRTAPPPSVHAGGDESIVVVKEEFLDTVLSSTGYQVKTYPINPGDATTFRWLSGMSKNYQNYRVEQLLVRFESQLTNAVASFQSMGSMMICGKTNAAAPAPMNQAEFEQTEFATVVRPNLSVTAPIEMNPREGAGGVKIIRTSPVIASNTSINDYDSGNVFVATAGMPEAGITVGRLYLVYRVKLFNPVLYSAPNYVASYRTFDPTPTKTLGAAPPVAVIDTFPAPLVIPDEGASTYRTIRGPAGCSGTFIMTYDAFCTVPSAGPTISPTFTLSNLVNEGFRWHGTVASLVTENLPTTLGAQMSFRTSFTVIDPSKAWSIAIAWPGCPTLGTANLFLCSVTPNASPSLAAGAVALTQAEVRRMIEEAVRSRVVIEEPDDPPPPIGAAAGAAASAVVQRRRG
jgi:hypothetical protein